MSELVSIMQQIHEGRFPELLGVEYIEVSRERAVVRLPFRKAVTMPYGHMHGGAIAALTDTAAGAVTAAGLRGGQTFTTVELKLNLISAVKAGGATAVAVPLHWGRRTAVIEVRVSDDGGKLVAIFTCTQMLVQP